MQGETGYGHRTTIYIKESLDKNPYRQCYRQVDSFSPSALTLQRYEYFLITNNKYRENMETTDNNKPNPEQQPLVAKTIRVEQLDTATRSLTGCYEQMSLDQLVASLLEKMWMI